MTVPGSSELRGEEKKSPDGTLTFNVTGHVCVRIEAGYVRVGTEITLNVILPHLSIIHFQSIVALQLPRQLGDDASKIGSIA